MGRMISIMFVCHGNICRSPMAEFIFKNMAEKAGRGDAFHVASAATSYEEIGNPVHPGTAKVLDSLGIAYAGKRAVHLEKSDYAKYDYLVCMDDANVRNTLRIVGSDPEKKVRKLLEFADSSADVADPWYTGNFRDTYRDVLAGCEGLFSYLEKEQRRK